MYVFFFFFHAAKNILPPNIRPMKLYDKSNTLTLLNYCKSVLLTLNMENKRGNAHDAAFKLKAIDLRWDCESDKEETEVSDEVVWLFNSDTEEDDFDGFNAQEDDEEGDQWLSW